MERACAAWDAPEVDYSLAPWALTWDEADPGRHPFDASSPRDAIGELAPAPAVPVRPAGHPADRDVIDWAHGAGAAWADAMSRALIAQYGRWASGWRWARDEGDFGGGPIGNWCCPRDSITSAEETLDRVAAALVEWRTWLEDLAERFEHHPLAGPESDRLHHWERGVVHLVHHVVDRTGAGDAWYRHCAQVLTWYLAYWGVEGERAGDLVDRAIGGRFDSWAEPAETTVADIAEQLAAAANALPGAAGD